MSGAARESKAALVRSPVRYGNWTGDGRAGKQVSKKIEERENVCRTRTGGSKRAV